MSDREPPSDTRIPEAPPLPDGHTVGEHHAPGGGFRNPWPPHPDAEDRAGGFFRWQLDRLRGGPLAPTPAAAAVPHAEPAPAYPRAAAHEIRVTFVGHATLLLQVAGLNLLTDPIWTKRAGPFSIVGGPRFTEPGLALADLPPLDGVLLSHGHYDHLDWGTVRMLRDRFGAGLTWYTPLGYARWLRRRGVESVVERDWWHEAVVEGPHGPVRLVCLPVRHWTRRGLHQNRELWCSWLIRGPAPRGPGGRAESVGPVSDIPRGVFFGADSGWCPAFHEIGERLGPFRASLLPIGAYEPRWFMAPFHMNPEDAVRAYRALGGEGAFVGIHWGAFRLTDEDPLEPPERTRGAWREAGLDPAELHLPGIGGTVRLDAPGG